MSLKYVFKFTYAEVLDDESYEVGPCDGTAVNSDTYLDYEE